MTVQLIFDVVDQSGTKGTTEIKLAGTPTIAQQTGFAVVYAEAMDALIEGKIAGVSSFVRPDVSSLDPEENDAAILSDVERIGKFEFATGSGDRVKFNLPALNEVEAGTDEVSDDIDTSATAMEGIIDAMLDGIAVTGGTIAPCDVGGVSLTNLIFAREAYTNSGKRR
jgi:hypothetical protein